MNEKEEEIWGNFPSDVMILFCNLCNWYHRKRWLKTVEEVAAAAMMMMMMMMILNKDLHDICKCICQSINLSDYAGASFLWGIGAKFNINFTTHPELQSAVSCSSSNLSPPLIECQGRLSEKSFLKYFTPIDKSHDVFTLNVSWPVLHLSSTFLAVPFWKRARL